jgi:hypothetical protein
MVEIFNPKIGATIIKLNATVKVKKEGKSVP